MVKIKVAHKKGSFEQSGENVQTKERLFTMSMKSTNECTTSNKKKISLHHSVPLCSSILNDIAHLLLEIFCSQKKERTAFGEFCDRLIYD